jgi:hypothetical protein
LGLSRSRGRGVSGGALVTATVTGNAAMSNNRTVIGDDMALPRIVQFPELPASTSRADAAPASRLRQHSLAVYAPTAHLLQPHVDARSATAEPHLLSLTALRAGAR